MPKKKSSKKKTVKKKSVKNKEKVEVFVCPRCQSVNVGYVFGIKNIFGVIPKMKCEDCGFENHAFPKWIIDKEKIPKGHGKKIKMEQKDTKKVKTIDSKTKITEKYCSNCKDEVKVKMKDGDVDVFVCENCKFEIKEKNKKK